MMRIGFLAWLIALAIASLRQESRPNGLIKMSKVKGIEMATNSTYAILTLIDQRPMCSSVQTPTHCRPNVNSILELRSEKGQICWLFWTCDMEKRTNSACGCIASEKKTVNLWSEHDFDCQTIQAGKEDELENDMMDMNLCTVSGELIKKCHVREMSRKTMDWVSQDERVFFVPSLKTRMWQDASDINMYSCATEQEEQCFCEVCDGDRTYCDNFACLSGSCICKIRSQGGIVHYAGNTVSFPIGCWGRGPFEVEMEVGMDRGMGHYGCQACEVSCSKGSIFVDTHGLKPVFLRLCLGDHCISEPIISHPVTIQLTKEMAISGGMTSIRLWVPDKKTQTTLLAYCNPVPVCEFITCHGCWDRWENPLCYSWLEYLAIILITMIVTFCSVGFLLMIRFVKPVAWILTKLFSWALFLLKRLWRLRPNLHVQLIRQAPEEEELLPAPAVRRRPMTRSFLLGMILLMVVSSANSCSESTSFSVDTSSCTHSETGIEACSITTSSRLSVSPVGQTSCFLIKDPLAKPIGSIALRTDSINLVCKENILYYAPFAEVRCSSTHVCREVGNCTDNNCESTLEDSIYAGGEGFTNVGWTECTRVCGCAACGCFVCSPACLWYRAFLTNPTKQFLEVTECSQWVYEVDLTVMKTTISNVETQKLVLTPGVPKSAFHIKFSLTSISIPPQPVLNKCIARYRGKISLVECNRGSVVTSGIIGDVRCPTKLSATETLKSCSIQKSAIDINVQSDSVVCTSGLVDPLQIFQDNLLPLSLEGMVILEQDSRVIASVNSIGLFEIQMSMNSFKLISKTSLNACFMTIKKFSGCHSCITGAQITYIGNTNFGQATGQVTCAKLGIQFPVSLDATPTEYNQTIRLNNPEIDAKCVITCPAGDHEFSLKGNLQFMTPKVYSKRDRIVGTQIVNNETLSGSFLWKTLSGFSWFRTIWWTLFAILILCIIGLIAFKLVLKSFLKLG